MKTTYTKDIQSKKVDELHFEIQGWKSSIYFIQDEITFIDHLLNSYLFEPNTPNLFERLQIYMQQLKNSKNNKTQLIKRISKHESDLGGMIECTDESCDFQYYQKHNILKAEVVDFVTGFSELKSKIFNYAGSILKKRKPANNE